MADPDQNDRRRRAYAAASRMTRDRMADESPLDAAALAAIERSDIVVVPGTYDHVEQVLDALDLPHRVVPAGRLHSVRLRPEQLLVVNCPGQLPAPEIVQVRDFVEAGGTLFSTDWALRHLVEPAFPGILEYNERATTDTVVRIEVLAADSPYLAGVLHEADDPQWWLEGSSYPIRILDPDRVEVLLRSKELGEQWGEAPVAVTFGFGAGEVFHMISHYYLQRTELRSKRHRAPASDYWAEKGRPMDPQSAALAAGLSLGEVESGYSSARLFANIAADKKRRQRTSPERRGGGAVTSGRCVTLRDEVSGADERHLRATVTETGALRIDGQDFGPSTAPVSPDGEYEWVTVVGPEHVPTLIGLLGGSPGDDVLDLLEQRWSGPRSYGLERVLRESGIPVDRHVF